MTEGNEFIFEGSLDQTAAKVQQLGDIAEAGASAISTQLDEFTAEASRLKTELASFSGGGANAGEVDAAVVALKEEKAQIDAILAGNTANLGVLRQQLAVQLEQVAVRARLQGVSELGEIGPSYRTIGFDPSRRVGFTGGAPLIPYGPPTQQSTWGTTASAQEQEQATRALAAQKAQALSALAASTEASYALRVPQRSFGGQTAGQQLAAEKELQDELERNAAIIAQQNEELARQVELTKQAAREAAYARGQGLAQLGRRAGPADIAAVTAAPSGLAAAEWTAEDAAIQRTNLTLGQYDTYAADAALASDNLTAATLRLGAVQAQASNELRAHGALTTEYISALARGETTISELSYQMGATIGKFAGWAGAAALTYGALGAVVEFGKGAIDTASAVQTLSRTIPNVNKQQASQQIGDLAQRVNEPIAETGSAVFQASRTFHSLADAVTAGGLALAAFKLDGVAVADSVKAMTALSQQFGLSANDLVPVFDQLAAGQQKYNARITDMIPLLQRAAGSIKNAGGNLTDLITLGQVALKTTQLSGSQVGTIFQRAASNYLSPNTPKGIADLSYLRNALGINTNVNITTLIGELIKRSATATPRERAGLATAFGGTGYGARGAALFGGAGAPLLASATKTNADAKGTLAVELEKALGTPTQELQSFKIALQNLGGALSNTGAFTAFGVLFKSIVDGIHAVTGLVDAFDKLSPAVKQILSLMVELRLAMLFVSRTRLGGSIPGISSIPGFRPSQATRDRQDLALYNRPVITNLEGAYASQSANLIKTTTRQAQLRLELAAIERGEEGALQEGVSATEASVLANAEMKTLLETQARQLQRITITRLALNEAQARQNSYTATNPRNRISAEAAAAQVAAVGALGGEAGAVAGATERSAGLIAYGSGRLAVLKRSIGSQVASLRLLAAEELGMGASMERLAAQSVEADVALVAAEAETVTAGVALRTTVASVRGFGASLLGLAKGFDPLLAGIIVLPLVYDGIKSSIDSVGETVGQVQHAEAGVITSVASLEKKAADLKAASAKATSASGGFFTKIEAGFGVLVGGSAGNSLEQPRKRQQYAGELGRAQAKALTTTAATLTGDTDLFQITVDKLRGTPGAMRKLRVALGNYRQFVQEAATEGLGTYDSTDIAATVKVFDAKLKQIAARRELGNAEGGGSAIQQVLQLNSTQQEGLVKYLDDYSKLYGAGGIGGTTGKNSINAAIAVYAKISNEYSSGKTDASLQAVQGAQTNLAEAINKNADDLLASSKVATSFKGQVGDINAAGASLDRARASIKARFAGIIAGDKGHLQRIAAALGAEHQLLSLLDTTFATATSDHVAAIAAQGTLATSEITGISPEAGIQREQSAIASLRSQLASVRGNGPGDFTERTALQAQLNDAANSLASSQASNATAIIDAQGQLAQSAIIGLDPSLDITRATAAVTAARNKLAQAQSSGAGTAAILTAQAALNSAQQTLLSTIQSTDATLAQNLQAFNDSQAALSESKTTNPVAQANQETAAAIKALAAIKPQNYRTNQEYQTALANAEAKVNNDKKAALAALVAADQATLKFELDTHRISQAQYVAGLQQLLKMKKLALDTRRSIQEEIFSVNQSAAVNLNVGNIKLPTSYQVRAAMKNGLERARRAGIASVAGSATQPGVQTTTNNTITVNVSRDVDLHKVADVFHKLTGASLTGVGQSMGMV